MMNTLYSGNDQESENTEKSPRLLKMIDMKLLESRKIFLWGPVDDDSAKEVASKILYLESIDPGKKITFFINYWILCDVVPMRRHPCFNLLQRFFEDAFMIPFPTTCRTSRWRPEKCLEKFGKCFFPTQLQMLEHVQ